MLLRNKQTGKITEIEEINLVVMNDERDCYESFAEYHSLTELNSDWEDYEPKEPLINDEKIRKAVRVWAEANNIKAVYYSPEEDGFYVKNFDDEIVASIYFGDKPMEEDGYGEHYTIAELCGEEGE